MALILGKKTFGRLETLQYANDKFGWRKDVIIGISAYYGFWAWLFARLTRRKCIYYCIDFYSPEIGYTWWDKVFIWLAMQMDKFLVRHCDETWNISKNINTGRLLFGGYISFPAKVVPLSYPPSYFRFENDVIRDKCVFVGLVPYGVSLLEKFVWLRGLPLVELLYQLSHCGIGISLWEDNGNNFYGDPGKTKLYSACGLPVIMTPNTPYADIIEKTKAGLVVPYDKIAVDNAINIILADYDYYKGNVKKTWKYINADNILGNSRLLG